MARTSVHQVSGRLWRPAARLVSGAFSQLARLRQARVFHPRGVLYSGRWESGSAGPRSALGASHPVTVRLSKGLGMPGGLADILGLAVRVHDDRGPWDLTFASAGTGPLGRALVRPGTAWHRARFSSIVPYRTAQGARWLLARFDDHRPDDRPASDLPAPLGDGVLEVRIDSVGVTGRAEPFARMRLDEVHPDDEHLAYDPMSNPPPGLGLYPRWLSTLRELAYHGSRAGRNG